MCWSSPHAGFKKLTSTTSDQLQFFCQRSAAGLVTLVSSTDDPAVAEATLNLFLETLSSSGTVRDWMDPEDPFMMRFGMHVCGDPPLVLPGTACQRLLGPGGGGGGLLLNDV